MLSSATMSLRPATACSTMRSPTRLTSQPAAKPCSWIRFIAGAHWPASSTAFRQGVVARGSKLLMIHTGGNPGLFAYQDKLASVLDRVSPISGVVDRS